MTRPATFHESSAERRVQSVPLAHVSIELGHLYAEDLGGGPEALRQAFAAVAPWLEAARTIGAAAVAGRARISTCFLVDDYFSTLAPPMRLVPQLLAAAQATGLQIDYLARESGCAEADGVPLARLVEERIVEDPPPGSNGLRPPVTESGWLCNGNRAAGGAGREAMGLVERWRPPAENAARRHSVFVDVELWDETGQGRTWSCAYLAGVWQLLRLGLLRCRGAQVAVPQPFPEELPQQWDELPTVIQCNPRAAPFTAYRNLSILPGRFMPTEQAVRTLLSQVAVDPEVAGQIAARGQAEGLELPPEPVDRIGYVFLPR